MYSSAFCKVYNEFGWNYFPEAFGEQLLLWLQQNDISIDSSLDLGCGTGILCQILHDHGIKAAGMDLSEGMIAVAKENHPDIRFDVADMVRYQPDSRFDLVTCTGDALNHIMDLRDIDQIFNNVYNYMNPGGYFIFDILNEKEITPGESIDLDFSETVKAQFMITRNAEGVINLKTTVFENGEKQFEENIYEIVHDTDAICALLQKNGFQVLQCAHHLLEVVSSQAATWFVIAQKPQ